MNEYVYKARDAGGALTTGTVRAFSAREAAKLLSANLIVIDIQPKTESVWRFFQRTGKKFPLFFARSLSVMLGSGMPVQPSLKIMAGDTDSPYSGIINSLFGEVSSGSTLADAMRGESGTFPADMISLVEAGEKSGTLSYMIANIADYLAAEYDAREKFITLMIYPVTLALSIAATLGVLMKFIMPSFTGLFKNMNTELPLPTKIVVSVDEFISGNFILIIVILAFLLIAVAAAYRKKRFRQRADRLMLRVPVFGKIALFGELGKFARTLSILIGSGMVLDEALDISASVTGNAYLEKIFREVHLDVQKGEMISESFRKKKIFPAIMTGLLISGDDSGELEKALGYIGDFCMGEADTATERARAVMPSVILIALGAAVGLVVFAVALPILDSITLFM